MAPGASIMHDTLSSPLWEAHTLLNIHTVGTCAVRVTRVHWYVSASRLCRGVSRVRPTPPTL